MSTTNIAVGYEYEGEEADITICVGTDEIRLTQREGEFVFAMLAVALNTLSEQRHDTRRVSLVQPRVNGKPFRCECGSNVFRQSGSRYSCNGCRTEYEGAAKEAAQ